jgi:energy-coupling factor transporter ATP-binding protein EcfA2
MRYTALILKGYRRMSLNQIGTFTIRPTEAIQLILGTNGSGKSSLIKELTPLPANPADYIKEGSKEIHIVDRGHQYVLTSSFSSGNKHSFIKDGEELNPGGTGSVQKELVRQEFRITADTHDLVTGMESFTSMSPSRRREWFTQLSDVNYDYAITVYNRLREEYRNVSGALKLDKKQLVTEQARIVTEEEQQQLIKDVKELHVEMTRLIEMRAPVERPLSEVDAARKKTEAQLRSLSERLLTLRVESPAHLRRNDWGELEKPVFNSVEDVDRFLEGIRHRITAQEAVLSKSVTDHEKLKETVEILKKRGTDGVKSVQLRIQQARDARDALLKGRQLKLEGMDPVAAMQSFESIHEAMFDLLSRLPENQDEQFSRAKLDQQREHLLQLKDTRTKKGQELAHFQAKKQHLEQHKASGATTCPKCQHTFTQGVSPEALEVLARQIEQSQSQLAELETWVAKTEERIAHIQSYGELFREVHQTMRGTPALRPFWDHLLGTDYLRTAPKVAANMLLGALREDLELEVKAKRHVDDIDELTKLLVQSEELGDQSLAEVSLKLGESSLQIEALTRTLSEARQELNAFMQYRRQLMEAIDLAEQITVARRSFSDLTNMQVETLRRMTIQQCIQQTQSTLARKEEILNALNQQKAVVESLTRTIARRTLEEEALKASVRALSPTDGLIAEGLLGFIKSFTHQMNQLIRKIWAYPLEIQPCGMSGEKGAELDYKFPLLVGSRDNIVQDVSRGSSGMQEIVDLSFKVIAMKYLHLEQGALMLDEFGKTLDLEHRHAAVMAIKTLMDTKPFTQLFMISHYESHYGAFTNAEVCVLDARNIAVPKVYNTHVSMH